MESVLVLISVMLVLVLHIAWPPMALPAFDTLRIDRRLGDDINCAGSSHVQAYQPCQDERPCGQACAKKGEGGGEGGKSGGRA